MTYLVFVLYFAWLKEGVGKVDETYTYPTKQECLAAKDQMVKDKIYPNRPGDLVYSHALRAECRER
jgi:molybdopterin converting factor small subunit